MITSVMYIDAAKTLFEAVIDGNTFQTVVPQGDVYNRIVAWIAAGNTPAAYVPPQPVSVTLISYADLRLRFTDAERKAILTACQTKWQIDDFVRLAQADGRVNLRCDLTAAAKAALVAAALLTADRAAVVFAIT